MQLAVLIHKDIGTMNVSVDETVFHVERMALAVDVTHQTKLVLQIPVNVSVYLGGTVIVKHIVKGDTIDIVLLDYYLQLTELVKRIA